LKNRQCRIVVIFCVVEEGSVARQEVIAMGRDLVIAGEAMSDVVSINGSTRVEGRVGGDVIVLGWQPGSP